MSAPPALRPDRAAAEPASPRRAWLAFGLLLFVFELLPTARVGGFDPTLFRPTIEPWLWLGIAWWARGRRNPTPWRALLTVWVCAVCAYRLDTVIFFFLMRQEPLLYDQAYMLRHAWVLIGDLWNRWMFLGLVAFFGGLLGAAWATRRAVGALFTHLEELSPARLRRNYARLVVTGVLLGGLQTLLWGVRPERPIQRFVRWDSVDLALNLRRSLRLHRAIERGLARSPYRAYDALRLERRPDLRLYLVESYGAVLATHPELAPWWRASVTQLEESLAAKGWSMASAFVRAPVSGGRSWLAEASILTGVRVRYEAEMHQLLTAREDTPHFVRFLARQGYRTVALAPADRARAGVPEVNRYDYDQIIDFDDLDYPGQRWGWGIVPDEYSLGKADELLIERDEAPLFLNAHLVTSHAPWKRVPTLTGSWRTWKHDGEALAVDQKKSSELKALKRSLSRFRRPEETRFMYAGEATDERLGRYRQSIAYELEVLAQRIEAIEDRDTLIVIMGDHQPPLITPETDDFSVPVHVLASDPRLLAELRELGFTDGLVLEPHAEPAADHAGLFSLLVRNLAACCAQDAGGSLELPEASVRGLTFDTTP